MSEKEKIRAEIERLIELNEESAGKTQYHLGRLRALQQILSFIDSLPEEKLSNVERIGKDYKEEPASKDLEEASRDYADNEEYGDDVYFAIKAAFKAGAKWQKDKMVQNTIDAHCFGFQGAALFSFRLPAGNYLVGSEVKVIIIKED